MLKAHSNLQSIMINTMYVTLKFTFFYQLKENYSKCIYPKQHNRNESFQKLIQINISIIATVSQCLCPAKSKFNWALSARQHFLHNSNKARLHPCKGHTDRRVEASQLHFYHFFPQRLHLVRFLGIFFPLCNQPQTRQSDSIYLELCLQ